MTPQTKGRKDRMVLETPRGKCSECGREIWLLVKGEPRICRQCRSREKNRRLKAWVIEQMGGKCQRCGYCRCAEALDMHHREPEQKRFTIRSRMVAEDHSLLLAEMEKCDLLCANCHREVHAEMKNLKEHRWGSESLVFSWE